MSKKSNYVPSNMFENVFWNIIKTQKGVLMLKGKPGIGKSARFKALCQSDVVKQHVGKEGLYFCDVRLAQMDETDIIGIPSQKTIEVDGKKMQVSGFNPPEWLVMATTRPTLILFDELNRAQAGVRNAALQLLLERQGKADDRSLQTSFNEMS